GIQIPRLRLVCRTVCGAHEPRDCINRYSVPLYRAARQLSLRNAPMIERRPLLDFFSHAILILGVLTIAFPLYLTFVASTQTAQEVAQAPMSLLPGSHFLENYRTALTGSSTNMAPVGRMLWVSTVMALAITIGKIAISLISAFAVVYFRFPRRMLCFWMLFITLLLPVAVRINS